MYYVYILQSEATGRYYIGQGNHLIDRFRRHQEGRNKATRGRGLWLMPYYRIFETRTKAMTWERSIKTKKSAESIRRVIRKSLSKFDLKVN